MVNSGEDTGIKVVAVMMGSDGDTVAIVEMGWYRI